MYDDCNVVYEDQVIPVAMQDLNRSKGNIKRGKVGSFNRSILTPTGNPRKNGTRSLRPIQNTFVY
jgi:hypothetical protein